MILSDEEIGVALATRELHFPAEYWDSITIGDWKAVARAQLDKDKAEIEQAEKRGSESIANRVEGFLQNHLYARPDRVWAKMKFEDWVWLHKFLLGNIGKTNSRSGD